MIFTNAALKTLLLGAEAIRQVHANKHDKGEDHDAAPLGNLRAAGTIKVLEPFGDDAAAPKDPTTRGDENQAMFKPPPPGGRLTNATSEKKLANATAPWCKRGSSIGCIICHSMHEDGSSIDRENRKFAESCLPDELTVGLSKGDAIPGDHQSHPDIFYHHGCCLDKASSTDDKDGGALGLLEIDDEQLTTLVFYETDENNITLDGEGLNAYGEAYSQATYDYLGIETSEELYQVCPKGNVLSRELRPIKIDICKPTQEDGTYKKVSINMAALRKQRENTGALQPGDTLQRHMAEYFLNDDCEAILVTSEPSAAPSAPPSETPSSIPSSAPSSSPSSIPTSSLSSIPSSAPSSCPTAPTVTCMSLTSEEANSPGPCSFCTLNSCCREGGDVPCFWLGEETICEGACNGIGACYNLPNNADIGPGSCNGKNACYDLGENAAIGAGSCNGYKACYKFGYYYRAGDITIGENSCVGTAACYLCKYENFVAANTPSVTCDVQY